MRIDVKKIAALSKLSLSKEEQAKIENQLEETLGYIDNLEKVKTEDVEPTSQVTGLENVLREDEVEPSLTQEDALANARSTQNGFFKVKGILKNE